MLVITDRTPSKLGIQSGLIKLFKDTLPEVIIIHCLIHRQSSASRVIPEYLSTILKTIIKNMNFIRSSSINRLFQKICIEIDSDFDNLLYILRPMVVKGYSLK